MTKNLQRADAIVDSLLELKEELWKLSQYDETARMILFKINSCLFSEYPVSNQLELPL